MESNNLSIPRELAEQLGDALIELSERGKIRKTNDGLFSVFDVIELAIDKGSPREVWKRLSDKDSSKVVTKCDNFQFPGQGQRSTPVTNLSGIFRIIIELPGNIPNKIKTILSNLGEASIAQVSLSESTAITPVPVVTPSPEMTAMLSMMTNLSTKLEIISQKVDRAEENKRFVQEVAPGLTVTENLVIESKGTLPAVVKYFTAPEWLEAHRSEFSCVPKQRFCLDVSRHYRVMLQNRPLQQNGKFLYNSTHEFVLRNIAESIKADRKKIIEYNRQVQLKLSGLSE